MKKSYIKPQAQAVCLFTEDTMLAGSTTFEVNAGKETEVIMSEDVHSKINLCTNDDIKSLFAMTPYYYKTSEADRKKLDNIDTLETTTEFRVAVYKKLQ